LTQQPSTINHQPSTINQTPSTINHQTTSHPLRSMHYSTRTPPTPQPNPQALNVKS